MRHLVRGQPAVETPAEDLAVWGIQAPADIEVQSADFDVWPENMTTVDVLCAMGSQWNVGMSGRTGLRYEAIPFVLRMSGIPRAEWRDIYDGLRLAESEALRLWREAS